MWCRKCRVAQRLELLVACTWIPGMTLGLSYKQRLITADVSFCHLARTKWCLSSSAGVTPMLLSPMQTLSLSSVSCLPLSHHLYAAKSGFSQTLQAVLFVPREGEPFMLTQVVFCHFTAFQES